MKVLYGEFAPRFLKLYPGNDSISASASYNDHYRDTSLISSWLYANKWSLSAKSPIYTYFWDHSPPGSSGATHMSEIVYCLNNLRELSKEWTTDDRTIAEKMSSYWVNFARTGNPNRGDSYPGPEKLTEWQPSLLGRPLTMHVGNGWGDVPIAEKDRVLLISEFFNTQNPF